MKAQVNLEFLAAAGLYMIALGIVVTSASDILPGYRYQSNQESLNLEARTISYQLMTSPGKNSTDDSNWEDDLKNVQNVESIGLATDFLELERAKIQALSTFGEDAFNYSQFKQVADAENQYRFIFTWMPTVRTNKTFEKSSPPDSNPDISEPQNGYYDSVDNKIHYGKADLGKAGVYSDQYHFLVTAKNGVYNGTYVSDNWDFTSSDPVGKGDRIEGVGNTEYLIGSFQNRPSEPGSLLIVQNQTKRFGASPSSDSTVIRITRFGVMEGEPLKIEVLAW